MKRKRKNPHAVAMGRKGGKKKSKAKSLAAYRNIMKRWGNPIENITEK